MSTIVSNRTLENPILFIGGLSLNELQVRAFRAYFPELLVPPTILPSEPWGSRSMRCSWGSRTG